MKHLLTITVFVSWLGMVALLVQRQTPPPALDVAALPSADEGRAPQDEWFGVYQGERKIGHAHRVLTRTAGGWNLRDESRLSLAMLGTPQPVTTALAAELDGDFALRTFRFALESPAGSFGATGESDGTRLRAVYGPPGRSRELVVKLAEPLQLPSTLRPRLVAAKPEPGARYTYAVLNPLTLAHQSIAVTVEGRETISGPEGPVETLRIAEEHEGLRARAWLDGEGRAVREEGMLGLVLRRETRAAALAGVDGAAPVDLALATRIPLEGTIAEPRAAATLTLRVRGAAARRVLDDPPRQRVTGDLVRIEREPAPRNPLGAYGGPATALGPSPFIESDDPGIVSRARAIVAGAEDPPTRARRLVRWVHRHLTQAPSLTVPSAREVLRARRGDCNEHAVLLTALARAAGIPARVVAGAVYAGDGFYYHAWTEVWLDRWVSADAVFDQLPADATHVKLLEGGPERHLELAAVVGQLAFATVEPGS